MVEYFKSVNPIFRDKKIRYPKIEFDCYEYMAEFDKLQDEYGLDGLVENMFVSMPFEVLDGISDGKMNEDYFRKKYYAFKDTNFFSLDKFFSNNYDNKVIIIQRDLRGNYNSTLKDNDKRRGLPPSPIVGQVVNCQEELRVVSICRL